MTELQRDELFLAFKQAAVDWRHLQSMTLTRTQNYNLNSASNYRRKPIRRKKKVWKRLRRNGQSLPSKKKSSKRNCNVSATNLPKRKRNCSTVTPANKRARIEEEKKDGVSTVEVVMPPDTLKVSPDSVVKCKKKVSIRCAKCGKNNITHPYLKFKCVPRYPAELGRNPTLRSVIARAKKILLHD